MRTKSEREVDFIIVGSGIPAMRAAVDLAHKGRVLILNKGELFKPASHYSTSGVAVALADDDEVRLHLHDTLLAGDGLCREDAVKVLVEDGPRLIRQLIEWGMRFQRNGTKLSFTAVGAHSRSRVLHAHGESTGGEMRRVLMAKAKTLRSIRIQPHAFVVDLVMEGDRVAGVTWLDEKSSVLKEVHSPSVLLATGGLGQVYSETTNPPFACGDGVAMGYRAGALISDMEFIQFHPTVLYAKGAPRFVLSEALCGEGAQLRNIDLERFMPRYHEAAERAPRDVVSRAVMMEMEKCQSEFHYLDLTGLNADHIKKRFPRIYEKCLEWNIDITADLIPVRPAAHYAMGGIATDLDGATSLRGLYAAGEVAATGVHGANRLASNSLLEDLVYGARVASAMARQHFNPHFFDQAKKAAPRQPRKPRPSAKAVDSGDLSNHAAPRPLADEVRTVLWEKVGIIRQGNTLAEAAERLDLLRLNSASAPCRRHYEERNILEVARLIARSALAREESRGAHYRSDFPLKNTAAPPRHSFIANNSPVRFY